MQNQPQISYHCVDESRYPQGKGDSPVGMLFGMENIRELHELQGWITRLLGALKGAQYQSLRETFATWISDVLLPHKHLPGLPAVQQLEEVSAMLSTRIKQWEQEKIQQGVAQGVVQGREEGERHEAGHILSRQLTRRFGPLPPWAQQRIDSAGKAELEHWAIQVFDAKTLEEVFL